MSVYTQLERQQNIFQYVGAGFHDPKTDPRAIKIADRFSMHRDLVNTHIWPVIRPEAGIPRPLTERTTHAITTLAECGDVIYPQLHVFVTQEPSLEGPLNRSEAVLRAFHQAKAPAPQRRSKGKPAQSTRPQVKPHQAASARGIDPDEVSYNLLAFRVDYSDHGQGKDHTNPHIHVLRFSPTLDARGDTIIKIDTAQAQELLGEMIRIGIATRDLFAHFAATRARSLGAAPIPATPQPAGPPRRLSDVVEQMKEGRGTNVQFTETFLVEDMADQERQTLYAASFVFRPEHPAQREEPLVDRILWVLRRQAIADLNVPNPHVCLWNTHEKRVLDAPLHKDARICRDIIENAMGDRIFYVKKEEMEMRLKLDPQWLIGGIPAYPEDTSVRVYGSRYFYLNFDDPIIQQSLADVATAQDAAMAALAAMHAPSEAPAAAAACAASSMQK